MIKADRLYLLLMSIMKYILLIYLLIFIVDVVRIYLFDKTISGNTQGIDSLVDIIVFGYAMLITLYWAYFRWIGVKRYIFHNIILIIAILSSSYIMLFVIYWMLTI